MSRKYSIRRMKPSEVSIAIEWALKEGWIPGLHDAETFYQADHQGFFLGLLDDEPIATGCAIKYDDHFAFCGLYIVKPEYRGKGYGMQLTQARLNYVGNRITGIDGVINNISKYERIGYVSAFKNTRYAFSLKERAIPSQAIVDLKTIPFNHVEAFDRRYFPAPRSALLRAWITQPDSRAFGYMKEGNLRGYGVIRKCYEGYRIGPLFAESSMIAKELLEALSVNLKGPLYLDVPEPNQEAQLLIKEFGMRPTFEVMRMYRNGMPQMDLGGIYGVTTYEIG